MDEKLKIDVQVTGKQDLKDFSAGMKEWRNNLRLLELQFKQGKISGGEFQITSGKLAGALKHFEDGTNRTASAQVALWHANNRVTLGFKSLATEVSGIHNKMRPANEQLREFYRQQRVGDRTMREGVQTLSMFSGALGPELGGALSTAANGFQQAEFAVNGLGIAAQSSTTKVASLGTALRGLSAPIAGLAALAVAEFTIVVTMLDRIEEAAKRIRKATGEKEKAPNPWFMKSLAKFAGAGPNAGLQGLGALASAVVSTETSAWKAEQAEMDKSEKATTKLAKATRELADAREKAGLIGPAARFGKEQEGLDAEARKRVGGRGYGGGIYGVIKAPLVPGFGQIAEEAGKAKQEMSLFAASAVSSLTVVGNTIASSIGQGFVNAFGIGHTLLGQFASSFLSFLTGGLFNLMTGGIGGLLGGATGGGIVGGGGGLTGIGGGNIGSMTSRGGGMGGGITVRVVGKISNTHIALAQERGAQVINSRRN